MLIREDPVLAAAITLVLMRSLKSVDSSDFELNHKMATSDYLIDKTLKTAPKCLQCKQGIQV